MTDKRGPANLLEDIRQIRSWLWKFRSGTTIAPGALPVDPVLSEDIRGALYIDEGGTGVEDVLLWVRKNAADAMEVAEVSFGGGAGITTEEALDAVGAALVAGNNIDITVNDGADTITIDVESLTSSDITDFATAVDERARDAVGTAIVDGDGITKTVDDPGNTITLDVDNTVIRTSGDQTLGGVKTFSSDPIIPDEAYHATDWNGSLEPPTKNAVRDKIEDILDGVTFTGDVVVPDEAYDAAWNGSLEVPTKNALYDKIETMGGGVTLEQVYDALGGGVLVAGNNIDITHVDGADTITIDVETLTLADVSDITASAAEVNLLDGVTASTAEINHIDGVTSAIQTQIDGKQPLDADLTTLATAFTTASASGAASLKFAEDTDNGSNAVTLAGPASTADVTITLPASAGTVALTSDLSAYQPLDSDLTTLSTAFTTASASGAASLAFHEDTDNGTNRVLLQGAASTADVTVTLPATTGTIYVTGGTDVAIADGGTGASTAADAATALGVGTGDSPQFTAVNVGHASDTTITRSSGGVIAVEGVTVPLNSTSSVHTASTIELGHASDTTLSRASAGVLAVEGVNVITTASTLRDQMNIPIGDGSNAISTGVYIDVRFEHAATITAATLLLTKFTSGSTGSIVLDLWKDTYANFPPTVADTITASAKPTVSAAAKSEDTTLTGWTTSVTAGDVIRINVDSASTVTLCTFVLEFTRTVA